MEKQLLQKEPENLITVDSPHTGGHKYFGSYISTMSLKKYLFSLKKRHTTFAVGIVISVLFVGLVSIINTNALAAKFTATMAGGSPPSTSANTQLDANPDL